MHFDIHQETNCSIFCLLYGFNRTGLCIFKWQSNANIHIPFSMFVFPFTLSQTKNTDRLRPGLYWAVPDELSFISRLHTQFLHTASSKPPSTHSLDVLKHDCSTCSETLLEKNHFSLFAVQEYRWNLTQFKSYKTINSKEKFLGIHISQSSRRTILLIWRLLVPISPSCCLFLKRALKMHRWLACSQWSLEDCLLHASVSLTDAFAYLTHLP